MTSEPRIVDLGSGVSSLDTLMSGYEGVTSGYLIAGDRPCLIESGTARSAPAVVAALAALDLTWAMITIPD